MTNEPKPPFPPLNSETAVKKVRLAEDAWNTRDPERVSLAYTPDSQWRVTRALTPCYAPRRCRNK
jgi:uncharacterized protein